VPVCSLPLPRPARACAAIIGTTAVLCSGFGALWSLCGVHHIPPSGHHYFLKDTCIPLPTLPHRLVVVCPCCPSFTVPAVPAFIRPWGPSALASLPLTLYLSAPSGLCNFWNISLQPCCVRNLTARNKEETRFLTRTNDGPQGMLPSRIPSAQRSMASAVRARMS
jgi:hypothetical protein